MRHTIRNEHGFTLIELLIVLVVLGILAGILLFAVNGIQGDADTAKDGANTRICATAKAASQAKYGDDTHYGEYLVGDGLCP